MAANNKVDMALEDIIALSSKRGRGRGLRGTRGRSTSWGRGRGRGRGRSQTPATRGTAAGGLRRGVRGRGARGRGRGNQNVRGGRIQSIKNNQRQASQQNRQAARNTSFDSQRNLPQQTAQQKGSTRGRGSRRRLVRPSSGQQRGGGISGRGRGQGVATSIRGRKFVRGGGRRGGASGRGRAQTLAAASVARARKILQTQNGGNNNNDNSANNGGRPTRRQRLGRGRRGRTQASGNTKLQVSFASPISTEPEGVELAFNFGANHHTKQSLNNRFSPAGSRKMGSSDRIVLPNGRSVEYTS